MNEQLIDECYSCLLASLVLIKSLAAAENVEFHSVIQVASGLGQTCVTCIRSHEAGSVLPEIADRLADECHQLVVSSRAASLNSPEALSCVTACEDLIHTYH
ncbi:MAG: hypothetical protein SFV81_12270 [Pirellulaceae bacterium]|nr:hypothetical protein [Pirellulaceae bacterium]